jgi:hypothetical protein
MSRRSRKKRRAAVLNGPRPSPEPQPRRWAAYLSPTRYALLAVLVGVAAYRFIVLADNPAPPGADPGNWLAFTHELFGTSVKAAKSVYFPVLPVLLKALLTFLPALMALKVVGVGASVLMGIPFYLILRRALSPIFSAGLTLAFILAGYQAELLDFGAYPQLLATTFFLFTVYWLMDGLISGRRRPLLLAAISTALAAGTHHFTLVVMAPTLLVLGAALFIQERPPTRSFAGNAGVWALATTVFTLPFLPWYIEFVSLAEGNPSNANNFGVGNMNSVTNYVFHENRAFWLAMLVIAAVVLLVPLLRRPGARIRPAALALLAGPWVVFVVTGEVRTFQMIEAGIVLSLAIPAAAVERHISQAKMAVSVRQLERLTLGLALSAFLIVVTTSGHERFLNQQRFLYQIVDDPALEALDWLRDRTPPGATVLANDSVSNVSYAWWVEGYAQRPTYSLISPPFLAFAEEKEQSILATRLLEQETPPSEVEAILQQTGIEYIFLDKRTGGRFKPLLSKSTFYLSMENEEFAILRHPQAEARTKP